MDAHQLRLTAQIDLVHARQAYLDEPTPSRRHLFEIAEQAYHLALRAEQEERIPDVTFVSESRPGYFDDSKLEDW